MISRTTLRAVRPRPRANGARFASGQPAAGGSNEVVETAQKYAKKAYDQGSVVAGKAYEQGSAVAGKALEGAKKYAGPYGEKAQGFLGSYRGPFLYNLSVAREILKQVYIRESLAPPKTLSEVQAAYKSLWEQASNVQWWKTTLENGQWKKVGIYALEAYGIFHIGEIVGRRSIVGYNLK